MSTRSRPAIWKGLVGVTQRDGVSFLRDAQGGYVNVVASANDITEFVQKVTAALDELGFDLIDIDEAEILPVSLSKANLSDEIRAMANTVRKNNSVAFGTFYLFDDRDEPN
jgi:hypothetical protein